MRQPNSLYDQFEGKAAAELFRGSGLWPLQANPVDLEPPFDEYFHRSLNEWDCFINNWQGSYKTGFLGRRVASRVILRKRQHLKIPPATYEDDDTLVPVTVATFNEDESTIDKAEQFLRSLPQLHRPASFEVIGLGPQPDYDIEKGSEILQARAKGDTSRTMSEAIRGWDDPYTTVQFVVHRFDANPVVNPTASPIRKTPAIVQSRSACNTVIEPLRTMSPTATPPRFASPTATASP